MQKRYSLDGLAILLMTALCLTWGVQQVVIKVAAEDVSPLLQAGIRSTGATILVLAWMHWRGLSLFERDGSLVPGTIAGVLFGAEFGLIFVGLTLTTASRAVILLYTTPFWVALGSHIFIPGERIRPLQVGGLLLAFAGVVLTFAERESALQSGEFLGDVLIVAAAILWAATTILIKASRLHAISPHKTLLYQLAVSGIGLIAAAIIMGEPLSVPATPFVAAALGFQIVIVAAISYVTWFWLIQRYPVSRLSAFSFLTPVFGVASGAIYLSEPITLSLFLALLLVAIGIYIVNMPKQSVAKPAESETDLRSVSEI